MKYKIEKISDLIVGNYYYLIFNSRLDARYAKRYKLLGIINEFNDGNTELYFESKTGNNLVYACEIGIGNNKKESVLNFGKLKFEKIESAYNNLDELRKKLEITKGK